MQVKQATNQTFTALLLGLGAVALLVGGVGVADTMIISVLERRGEIGWRRALGATRGQIRTQFLAEALPLSALGGAGGVFLGVAVTSGYAITQGWPVAVPGWAQVTAVGTTLVIGGIAGLYPAIRAAGLSLTEALAAPWDAGAESLPPRAFGREGSRLATAASRWRGAATYRQG